MHWRNLVLRNFNRGSKKFRGKFPSLYLKKYCGVMLQNALSQSDTFVKLMIRSGNSTNRSSPFPNFISNKVQHSQCPLYALVPNKRLIARNSALSGPSNIVISSDRDDYIRKH